MATSTLLPCIKIYIGGYGKQPPKFVLLLIVIQTTKDIITHGREQIEYELMVLSYVLQLRVPLGGTYIMKPTASCEAAQLWVRAILPPHIVPRRGTDASPMMLRMVVGPASRNQKMVRRCLSHSGAPSELAVGF